MSDEEILNLRKSLNPYGRTIEGADRHAVNTEQSEDVNFTNHGTITAADKSAFYCKTCPDTTFVNTGTMSGGNNTVVISHGDNISVTNSGTITATGANSGLSINQSDLRSLLFLKKPEIKFEMVSP